MVNEKLWRSAMEFDGRDKPLSRYRVDFRRWVTNLTKVRMFDYCEDAKHFMRMVLAAGGYASQPQRVDD